ncbi:hypothetical protein [Pseudoclavibacter endophyticus]|uniref:hypothetical protein n=1 Tax=Pseudoclavibacter endophyticus TaxID=1778590 RepID=UPI00166F1193|nr:hypothetical protein [Pseudoclavibacter endophyticus]
MTDHSHTPHSRGRLREHDSAFNVASGVLVDTFVVRTLVVPVFSDIGCSIRRRSSKLSPSHTAHPR